LLSVLVTVTVPTWSGVLMTEQFADLVLEGGGVKGIALVGAFSVIEERGCTRTTATSCSRRAAGPR
jgi:predicted acylesterase/phospholipase RssA